ncbi:UPF0481 protein At3g47200-like [Durio zibethinus]|uniref:UPF0481 protein At3g47200-like n=1 Tax=Durio zibethinus TaxID=66656 RepID=A0A6P5Z9L8_DURZI|nr:UPF0481 protein At3g47200-like [Durio zibethinus]
MQEEEPRMDPQDEVLAVVVVNLEEQMNRHRQQTPDRGTYTMSAFPDVLVEIDDSIQCRLPKLASFGPYHRDKQHLRPFEEHKRTFLAQFLHRTGIPERDQFFSSEELRELKETTKRCYPQQVMPSDDDDLVNMMLLDGCFMVELFRQYEEGRDDWPWSVPTLIADLLKLENQLPFFIVEKLFALSNIGQRATISTLPNLAWRFLKQVFYSTSNVVNSQIQNPKHLLDLFRSSLLPSTEEDPQQRNQSLLKYAIQSVKHLRNSGITVRQKTAKSLLEIEFRKVQLPPLALKIPPFPINDCTSTILVNCVALEQCSPVKDKHFTSYVCFMHYLVKEPEDVKFLRSVDIIKGPSQDEMRFINMLNNLGLNFSYSARGCYLWKQLREIHSYYNSCWASIRRNFVNYNSIMLYCSIIQIVVAILGWFISGN